MSALVVISIIEIVALWRIFIKAGEKGWKCLIPIYNINLLFKIAKNDDFLTLVMTIILFAFSASYNRSSLAYAKQDEQYIIEVILGLICLIAIFIYFLFILYRMYADLSERFGFKRFFALGLLLFSPVFMCILGFGNAEYRAGATEANNVLTDNDNTE